MSSRYVFSNSQSKALKLTTWLSMLIASSLPLVLWRTLSQGEPLWWPLVTASALVAITISTHLMSTLKPLRGFMLVLLLIFFLGFGGGWQWGLIPFVRESDIWTAWLSNASWSQSAIATHLLRLVPALSLLVMLTLMGRRRCDLFLIKGEINALAKPSKLLGMKKPEPWIKIGSTFAIIFVGGTLAFLILSSPPSIQSLVSSLHLIPVAILIAAINGFNEEFTLRAAPLAELRRALGNFDALILTSTFFGLGHYYGIPNGIVGVALSSFLGWFLGKSMLETRGFFWAWICHFLSDVVIFSFLAIGSA